MALIDNLISYYKLDGNSNDAVGSNNGTDTAITYNSGNGKINQGAGFNGTTSKIVLGTPVVMPTNLTISAWIKTTDYTTILANIIGECNSLGTIFWELMVNPGGTVSFFWRPSGGTTTTYTTTSAVITDNNWHFVCVTQVGTGDPIIYVDTTTPALTKTGSTQAKPTTAQLTAIGEEGNYNDQNWAGSLDEVGIWSRSLSSVEVTSLYNGGAGNQYPFNNVFFRTLSDSIMNGASRTTTLSRIVSYTRTASDNIMNSASRLATVARGFVFVRTLSDGIMNAKSRFSNLFRANPLNQWINPNAQPYPKSKEQSYPKSNEQHYPQSKNNSKEIK